MTRSRHATTAPRLPIRRAALCLALSLAATPAFSQEPSPEPRETPPIWTNEPVRVDRSKETRERIEPSGGPPPTPGIVVEGDGRLRDGTVIVAGGRRLRLFGLRAVDADRICADAEGHRWACGIRARAHLAAAVAGRTLVCRPTGPQTGPEPIVDCLVRSASLSETLLGDGWAELDDDGAADPRLAEAAARAKRDRRGIWAPRPPS